MSSFADLWPVGLTIYLLGTISEAFGANLQKYSINKEVEKNDNNRKPHKQPLWRIGLTCFILSHIFMSSAMIFCSQTFLDPLQIVLCYIYLLSLS